MAWYDYLRYPFIGSQIAVSAAAVEALDVDKMTADDLYYAVSPGVEAVAQLSPKLRVPDSLVRKLSEAAVIAIKEWAVEQQAKVTALDAKSSGLPPAK